MALGGFVSESREGEVRSELRRSDRAFCLQTPCDKCQFVAIYMQQWGHLCLINILKPKDN